MKNLLVEKYLLVKQITKQFELDWQIIPQATAEFMFAKRDLWGEDEIDV